MDIDTSSTPLTTLALPVMYDDYVSGPGEAALRATVSGAFCQQFYGQCPPENHLGEAKSRALETMADSQMAASARRAAMRSA